tara:strand:- start:341 stop:475 length:135 start_codon:yes stop_codon:yes gene_type:complete
LEKTFFTIGSEQERNNGIKMKIISSNDCRNQKKNIADVDLQNSI